MRLLSKREEEELIKILKNRFLSNKHRHENIEWFVVENRLSIEQEKLSSLFEMERTEGEPDCIGLDGESIIYADCSKESPKGRRSICYDQEALEARKNNKPINSAMNMAKEMGIELLDEEQYRFLQKLEPLDLKTSSWIKTSDNIRNLGGAIFCDNRYSTVFVYHNGADSYYSSRGFRGILKI